MITRSKKKLNQDKYNKTETNNTAKKVKKKNTTDTDDIIKMSIDCLESITEIIKPEQIISILKKKYPELFKPLEILKSKSNNQNIDYDLYDVEYIKFIYGSMGDYDSQYRKDTDIKFKDDDEIVRYFRNLDKKTKHIYLSKILEINKEKETGSNNMPVELQIISSNMSPKLKLRAQNMYDNSNPKYKLWTERLLSIPFKTYKNIDNDIKKSKKRKSQFLIESYAFLDTVVYGHIQAKNQIIQIVSSLISNNLSSGHVFGIQGPMGNGKTTLLKKGLSKILNIPFEMIQLGGLTGANYLNGHSFTYEGSQYGRIIDCLIQSKCMNPIIYFDELDKISKTEKGKEITGILTHLTDPSQNMNFQDKYFSGVNIDMSKAIFIFSFNDINKIDPILLDRINVIKTYGFNVRDKINIAKKFLIKEICNSIGFEQKNIIFQDECIKYVINNFTQEEKGVRNLKRIIETIISKINFLSMITPDDYKKININFKIKKLKFPLYIDTEIINILLVDEIKKETHSICSMYM
jgi:ATP-dependent Lon protease